MGTDSDDWIPVPGLQRPQQRYPRRPVFLQESGGASPEFIDACLGAPTPISFKSQKEAFQEILTDTLGEECDYEIVRQIHENLTELAEEHKEDEIPLTLTKPEVKDLLEKSGVEPERLEHFDKVYEEAAGENTAILVPAITGTGKFAVKTPDVDIKVNPDRLDLVETKFIGGRRCLCNCR